MRYWNHTSRGCISLTFTTTKMVGKWNKNLLGMTDTFRPMDVSPPGPVVPVWTPSSTSRPTLEKPKTIRADRQHVLFCKVLDNHPRVLDNHPTPNRQNVVLGETTTLTISQEKARKRRQQKTNLSSMYRRCTTLANGDALLMGTTT